MDEQIKILCVDDEENVLRALKRLFLDDDYEILTCTSGNEGLEILEGTAPIQVIISDYRMPGMDGVDFLKEVRKKWPDTVRIVLSGYADTASVVSAINEGHIYKFIPKPWNNDELKVTIANAIERYFLRQKNIKLTFELKQKNEELKDINANLEELVSERTSELIFQNKVLIRSQNILDSLPVGVLGIDSDGLIVQCNKAGAELFGGGGGIIIGMNRRDLFPEEINTFIEEIIKNKELSEHVSINGVRVKVKGVYIKHSEGQDGLVLVFDEDEKERDA
ncbi:MAG: response regulator [Deltaproteobacteria bacterium]|nr:response regulator [Deltaproteobacteria bacterium]